MAVPNRKRKRSAPIAVVEQPKGIEWPAYTVERWPIGRLRPYEHNARHHPPSQIAKLRTSLREFGWTIPILARPDGTVIAGHGRLTAALAEHVVEVPVIVANGWSEAQCRAYTIADNKLTEGGMWEEDALIAELLAIRDTDVDLAVLGFEDKALLRLLQDENARPPIEIVPKFQILVDCATEEEQADLLQQMLAQGVKCRAMLA